MALGGVHRDVQLRADLDEGQHGGQVAEHGPLPRAELLDQRRHGRGRRHRVDGGVGHLVQERPGGLDPVAVAGQQDPGRRAGVQEHPPPVLRLGQRHGHGQGLRGLVGLVLGVAGQRLQQPRLHRAGADRGRRVAGQRGQAGQGGRRVALGQPQPGDGHRRRGGPSGSAGSSAASRARAVAVSPAARCSSASLVASQRTSSRGWLHPASSWPAAPKAANAAAGSPWARASHPAMIMAATRSGRSGPAGRRRGPLEPAGRAAQVVALVPRPGQREQRRGRRGGRRRPGGGGVPDGGPPGGDGVAEPSLDGLDQGEVAQAGPLDLLQPGRPGRHLPGAEMGLGGVQVAGPQLGRAQTGQGDRQRVAGHPGGVAQRRAGVQGRPAGGQDLAQVAGAAGPQQPAGRQEQGEPGSPVAGQPALLLEGQLQGGLGLVVGDDPPGRPQQRQLGVEAAASAGTRSSSSPRPASWPRSRRRPPCSASRSAVRSQSSMATAWPTASAGNPFAPYQSAALRRSSATSCGASRRLVAQQLGEQRVVAVLLAPVAERHHEDVGPLQPGQGPLAVVAAGEGVGQLAAELVHDRGPDQEVAQLGRQAVQDLGDQVAGQAAVVAGQLEHEPAGRGGPASTPRPGAARPPSPRCGPGARPGRRRTAGPGSRSRPAARPPRPR